MGLRRSIYYRMSPAWRRRSRRIVFAPLDAWSSLQGQRSYNGIPLPRRGEIFTGGGDFLATGLRFLEYFQRLGGLEADDDVLEIGSGQGRMAIPLTAFLSDRGSYTGFDVVRSAVDDCNRRIASRAPTFRFLHVPVRNDLYTDTGAAAANLTFPLAGDSIDFAFATSVFSHMEPDEIANYIAEARRVVRPDGRLMATVFLMDAEAARASRDAAFSFPYQEGQAWYMSLRPRSANVAIAPEALAAMSSAGGWARFETLPGTWSGRSGPTVDYQDLVIFS